jgi:hypothetical protein
MRKTTIITTTRPVARARISETVVWERKPAVEYVPGPRSSLPPLIKTVTPPRALPAPPAASSPPEDPARPASSTPPAAPEAPEVPTTPPATKVELVSVVESAGSSSRGSRTSATSKSGRRSREEVYIERERETVRLDPLPRPSKDLDVFQYMEPPTGSKRASLESGRRRSITYGSRPRTATRTVEREKRLVIEDGSRRREYYH